MVESERSIEVELDGLNDSNWTEWMKQFIETERLEELKV